MDRLTHQCADLLLAIEAEMRRIGLWGATSPDAAAMASLMPFCHDTMPLEQWLQWVFLPRMHRVVESDEEWPTSSEIEPLAEYRFAQLLQPTARLLDLIRQFDELINRAEP